jgi:hypothetical protein
VRRGNGEPPHDGSAPGSDRRRPPPEPELFGRQEEIVSRGVNLRPAFPCNGTGGFARSAEPAEHLRTHLGEIVRIEHRKGIPVSTRMSFQAYDSLKQNLAHNLNTVASLSGQKGAKLFFTPGTGRFGTESDNDARGKRNEKVKDKDARDSATSSAMFEQPLLVTFYECRKLGFKDPNSDKYQSLGVSPDERFKRGVKGLVYLRDKTYDDEWFKGDQKQAITDLLAKLQEFRQARTRTELDALILKYVPFALPDTLSQFVRLAANDNEVKRLIKRELSWLRQTRMAEDKLEDSVAGNVGKKIYEKFYKTGGGDQSQVPTGLDEEQYGKKINMLAQLYSQQAHEKDGYFNFYLSGSNQEVRARVYIHLQADLAGQNARNALKVLFDNLASSGNAIDGKTRKQIVQFKIGTLRVLHKSLDSAVIYTKTYEAAKELAGALAVPLQPYTAPGLPAMVKAVPDNQGIGVAVQPERPLDAFTKSHQLVDQYSYGSHRSEIIARGLIIAAMQNHDTVPNDLAVCLNAVALKFQHYGIHPFKPHKASTSASVQ